MYVFRTEYLPITSSNLSSHKTLQSLVSTAVRCFSGLTMKANVSKGVSKYSKDSLVRMVIQEDNNNLIPPRAMNLTGHRMSTRLTILSTYSLLWNRFQIQSKSIWLSMTIMTLLYCWSYLAGKVGTVVQRVCRQVRSIMSFLPQHQIAASGIIYTNYLERSFEIISSLVGQTNKSSRSKFAKQ